MTRLDCYNPPLTIVNSYGEQDKVGKEEQEARWSRLRKELEDGRKRGDMCLLIGDQNKHVGADHLGVEGSLPRVSRGGHLVRDLLATGDWHLVNKDHQRMMVDPMFMIIQSLRSFLTAVTTTAVAPIPVSFT